MIIIFNKTIYNLFMYENYIISNFLFLFNLLFFDYFLYIFSLILNNYIIIKWQKIKKPAQTSTLSLNIKKTKYNQKFKRKTKKIINKINNLACMMLSELKKMQLNNKS
jgi:hypothetical protein